MNKNKSDNLKCGMVSIIGRPNVGKSTLLNEIIGEKVAIVSKVPQTTRNKVRGIYTDERGQIIFIDTPGLFLGKDRLDQMLKESCVSTTQDVDCIIHLVDASEPVGKEEEQIVKILSKTNMSLILGLNKVDLKGKFIAEYISLWENVKQMPVTKMKNFSLIALSGRKRINIKELLDIIFDYLPQGDLLYPTDTISDVPQRMAIADIIREKLFNILREELPHSVAVTIENMEYKPKKVVYIQALILIERESHKPIVIGKKGHILKRVGTLAREELEDLLESKVFLEIHVKVQKNWRDNVSVLEELGYNI